MKPTSRSGGLEPAAREARGLLGGRGFVRRDREGRALLVSDAPRRFSIGGEAARALSRLARSGWEAWEEGGLLLMDWTPARCRAFFSTLGQSLPAPAPGDWGLCAILMRHPGEWAQDRYREARAALLMWDRGDREALRALAGASLAQSLRAGRAPAPFYAPLLRSLGERTE